MLIISLKYVLIYKYIYIYTYIYKTHTKYLVVNMDLNQEKEQKLGQIKERVNELYPLGRSSQGLATFNELTRAEIVDNCVSGI